MECEKVWFIVVALCLILPVAFTTYYLIVEDHLAKSFCYENRQEYFYEHGKTVSKEYCLEELNGRIVKHPIIKYQGSYAYVGEDK